MAGHAGQTPYKAPVIGADGKPTNNMQWVWEDGTPLDPNEQLAAESFENGSINLNDPNALNKLFPAGVPEDFADSLGPNGVGGTFARMGKAKEDWLSRDKNDPTPLLPQVVTPASPGGALDTTQADEDARGTASLLADLQQQAATGGGAWEQALVNATQKAKAGASALGQEQQQQSGGNYANALRNIGNAQSGAQQRAAGQAEILRNKSKQAAQQGISSLTSGMQGTAASQAATQSAISQQIQDTNLALIGDAEKNNQGRASAMSAGLSSMSDGGRVPGEPEVFGDDERNDTQQAMLSPEEIVIPRSIATAPNAPDLAKAFVMAIQQREQGHKANFADGGETGQAFGPYASGSPDEYNDGGTYNSTPEDFGVGNYVGNWIMPHAFGPAGFQRLREKYAHPGRPSVENGGLFNTNAYNAARDAAMQNNASLMQSAQGNGPSIAPQMLQNTTDSNIEAAMAAQAAGKGGVGLVGQATAENQSAAGQAAGVKAQEQEAGQQGASRAFLEQQARDLAFSRAQQEAAWRNTMINAGLGLDQQAAMRNIFAGAGQAATALAGLGKEKPGDDPYKGFGETSDPYTFDSTSDTGSYGDFESDNTSTDLGGDSGSQYAAFGGRIKKKRGHEQAFAAACGGRA